MPSKSFVLVVTVVSLLPFVSAHGNVIKVVAGGKTSKAQNPYYPQGTSAVRLMLTNSEPNAFVVPDQFTNNAKMSCPDAGNKPAKEHLQVAAGSTVNIHWQGATGELVGRVPAPEDGAKPWVHATGPILDYLTDCHGDCTTFDATNAGWTKIAHSGIDMSQPITSALRSAMDNKGEKYYPVSGNGVWASAKLIQQASVWYVNIPKELKSGKYILRHEMSAMHSPGKNQNYISCIQLDVVNGGSATLPGGTQAKDLYQVGGQFTKFSIYTDDPNTFKNPGPAIWNPSGSSSPAPAPAPAPSSSPSASPSPKPPVETPSTPGKPTSSAPAPPAETRKCRQRKRAVPSPLAVAKRHRKRLSADH